MGDSSRKVIFMELKTLDEQAFKMMFSFCSILSLAYLVALGLLVRKKLLKFFFFSVFFLSSLANWTVLCIIIA